MRIKPRCLKCGTLTTPSISHRKFCLMCGIKLYKLIRNLNLLKLNFLELI